MQTIGNYKIVMVNGETGYQKLSTPSKVSETDRGGYSIPESERKAPYSHLAGRDGMIRYKGVTFVCDNERRSLSLGDMSREDKVLKIPLAEGTLYVNRDNLGDLSRAIGMFSPEDTRRILDAVAIDARLRAKQSEWEEKEAEILEGLE